VLCKLNFMLIVALIWWAGDFPELRRIHGR